MSLIMTFSRPSFFPDRAFGLCCSLAIHAALGLALIWPFTGPTAQRRNAARGENVVVVELLPLPSGETANAGGDRKTMMPQDKPSSTALPSDGRHGRDRQTPPVGGASPESGQTPGQGSARETAAREATEGVAAMSGTSLQSFRSRLLRHIERHRRYPPQAQLAEIEGVVQVHFVMNHKGEVLDIWIEMSSGSKLLDDEAIAAVMRARLLPPPPADWPGSFGVTLPIGFSLK
ncbi:energy transducer TonB [Sandaracinobacter sp. RS1-74]|uniref:energy transducer TonB n=1 Tax=Sandaracinobacteroides sayramensis TaxID=2913411 RepID=UPI001EDA547F|nr:energy transducer TonB [Sandaracinobacteroides sayramensis]MCG2841829.1 energy transducer TonB [Sandaracinobacteroides sayramensis]